MNGFKQLANIVDYQQCKPNPYPRTVSFTPRIDPVGESQIRQSDCTLWKEAVSKSRIQRIYHDSSFDNCPLIPSAIVNLGKNWTKLKVKPSLYLWGNTGSGKTYFATAIYRQLVESKLHPWMIFIRSDDLDDELLTAIEQRQEKTRMMKYFEVPILFIDDLGVERPSDRIIRQYNSIIDRRIGEGLITVVTSNVQKRDLPLGDRTISRLEHFYAIEFPKKDIRKTLDLPPL